MRLIKLTQGRYTIVDDDDFEYLDKLKWCFHKVCRPNNGSGYAVSNQRIQGKVKTLKMHRVIMGDPLGMFIDHINGDKLDNRKSNLRIVSIQDNNSNRVKDTNSPNRYKGVSFNKRTGKWICLIGYKSKRYYLGLFESEVDAAKAYNKKAVELSPFIKLNNIDI